MSVYHECIPLVLINERLREVIRTGDRLWTDMVSVGGGVSEVVCPQGTCLWCIVHYAPSKPVIASRKISCLLADGFDLAIYEAVSTGLVARSAITMVFGVRRSSIYPSGQTPGRDKGVMANTSVEAAQSTLFDALVIVPGADHILKSREQGRAIHWIARPLVTAKPLLRLATVSTCCNTRCCLASTLL